jgi:hypothetical protein
MTHRSVLWARENRERQRASQARHRAQPHVIEQRRTKDADRRAAARVFTDAAKAKPCADCGVQYPPYVMDLDHVRGEKLFVLSKGYNHSPEAQLAEIEKCDVVCTNCHRERTHVRRTHP